MKLSVSNIAWDGREDEKVYGLMKKYGYTGLEIAPTRIFPEEPYEKTKSAAVWADGIKRSYGFEICSMQSIWYGRQERLFGSGDEWESLAAYTEKAIDFAHASGCRNLVFGSPKNRALPENADDHMLQRGIDFFRRVGAYAADRGAVIGMEANPPIYNTNYINTTDEALKLIKETASDGFGLNLDTGTMIQNNESVRLLEGNVEFISHVHVSEPHLALIDKSAARRAFHSELAAFLRENDYNGYVSIEMAKNDEISAVSETLDYVREIFS